jgi:hypothetical protein
LPNPWKPLDGFRSLFACHRILEIANLSPWNLETLSRRATHRPGAPVLPMHPIVVLEAHSDGPALICAKWRPPNGLPKACNA